MATRSRAVKPMWVWALIFHSMRTFQIPTRFTFLSFLSLPHSSNPFWTPCQVQDILQQPPLLHFLMWHIVDMMVHTHKRSHIFWCNDFLAPVVSCQQTCRNLLGNPRWWKVPMQSWVWDSGNWKAGGLHCLPASHTHRVVYYHRSFPPDTQPRHDPDHSKTPAPSILLCLWCWKESMCLHLLAGECIYMCVWVFMHVSMTTHTQRM